MTIAGAAILFTRGVNTHNQLKFIVAETSEPKFKKLLKELGIICFSEDTHQNRDLLQNFIVQYGEEIYREYSKNLSKDEIYGYNLKG